MIKSFFPLSYFCCTILSNLDNSWICSSSQDYSSVLWPVFAVKTSVWLLRSTVLESDISRFESWLCHLLAVCLWSAVLGSLCFSFPTYKLEIIMSLPYGTTKKITWDYVQCIGSAWLIVTIIVGMFMAFSCLLLIFFFFSLYFLNSQTLNNLYHLRLKNKKIFKSLEVDVVFSLYRWRNWSWQSICVRSHILVVAKPGFGQTDAKVLLRHNNDPISNHIQTKIHVPHLFFCLKSHFAGRMLAKTNPAGERRV